LDQVHVPSDSFSESLLSSLSTNWWRRWIQLVSSCPCLWVLLRKRFETFWSPCPFLCLFSSCSLVTQFESVYLRFEVDSLDPAFIPFSLRRASWTALRTVSARLSLVIAGPYCGSFAASFNFILFRAVSSSAIAFPPAISTTRVI